MDHLNTTFRLERSDPDNTASFSVSSLKFDCIMWGYIIAIMYSWYKGNDGFPFTPSVIFTVLFLHCHFTDRTLFINQMMPAE